MANFSEEKKREVLEFVISELQNTVAQSFSISPDTMIWIELDLESLQVVDFFESLGGRFGLNLFEVADLNEIDTPSKVTRYILDHIS